jgi:hypothetical protein
MPRRGGAPAEESIYNLGKDGGGAAGPRMVKYGGIPAAGATAKVKMHADSSQVRAQEGDVIHQ